MNQRAGVGFQVFLGLAILVAAVPVLRSPIIADSPAPYAALEIAFILLIAAIPVIWRVIEVGRRGFVEPVALMSAGFVLYYVFRGIVLLERASIAHPDATLAAYHATDLELAITLGYVLIGFCLFHFGYRVWRPPLPETGPHRGWDTSDLNRAALVAICLAAASTFILVRTSGGISGLLNQFGCLRMTTAGYGYALLGLPYWSILFAFFLCDRLRRGASFLPVLPLLLMAGFCDSAFGNRTGVMATWATVFLLSIYMTERRWSWRTSGLLVGLVVAAVAFAVPMAMIRQSGCIALATGVRPSLRIIEPSGPESKGLLSENQKAGAPASAGGAPVEKRGRFLMSIASLAQAAVARTQSMGRVITGAVASVAARGVKAMPGGVMSEFVTLDSFTTIISAGPSVFPFRYGGTYLDGFRFIVPRRLWPTKPGSFSVAVGRYMLGVDNDLPPGLIGEAYINFRLSGVVVVMYLFGLFLRWAHRWTLSENPSALAAYSLLGPYLVIFLGRNFLGGGTLMLVSAGAMLPLIAYLDRPRRVARECSVLIARSSDFSSPPLQRRAAIYTRRGYRTQFAGWNPEVRVPSPETLKGVSCYYLMHGGGSYSVGSLIGRLQFMSRLFWYVLRADVDFVHVIGFDSALPVALACRFRRIPFIYDVFDSFERSRWPAPVKPLIARIDAAIARSAALMVVLDENRISGGISGQSDTVERLEAAMEQSIPSLTASPALQHLLEGCRAVQKNS